MRFRVTRVERNTVVVEADSESEALDSAKTPLDYGYGVTVTVSHEVEAARPPTERTGA